MQGIDLTEGHSQYCGDFSDKVGPPNRILYVTVILFLLSEFSMQPTATFYLAYSTYKPQKVNQSALETDTFTLHPSFVHSSVLAH